MPRPAAKAGASCCTWKEETVGVDVGHRVEAAQIEVLRPHAARVDLVARGGGESHAGELGLRHVDRADGASGDLDVGRLRGAEVEIVDPHVAQVELGDAGSTEVERADAAAGDPQPPHPRVAQAEGGDARTGHLDVEHRRSGEVDRFGVGPHGALLERRVGEVDGAGDLQAGRDEIDAACRSRRLEHGRQIGRGDARRGGGLGCADHASRLGPGTDSPRPRHSVRGGVGGCRNPRASPGADAAYNGGTSIDPASPGSSRKNSLETGPVEPSGAGPSQPQ
jgi:hypothetical protein